MAVLRVIWRGIQHLNHRGYLYIWANVAAVVCSLPLVTAPAAWAGLVKMSHQAHMSSSADLNDFWEGFRENLRNSLILSVLNILVIGVNVSNLTAYQGTTDIFISGLRFVWLGALVVWLAVQMYLFPVFYRMDQPTLTGAMRNALVMVCLNPVFTLGLLLALLVIMLLSTVLTVTWVLLTFSVLAVMVTGAVLDRLQVKLYSPVSEF